MKLRRHDDLAAIQTPLLVRIDGLEEQIRDLLEEREELLTEIVRLRRGNHPAGRALRPKFTRLALLADAIEREALTERDAEHEGGGGDDRPRCAGCGHLAEVHTTEPVINPVLDRNYGCCVVCERRGTPCYQGRTA